MSNKIIYHCAGGAGINMGRDIVSIAANLGDGFCTGDINYIDTSTNNVDSIEDGKDKFFHIKSKGASGEDINGSGSERKKNVIDIMGSVKDYLDSIKVREAKIGEYHVVLFSASGGSGNVIATAILTHLLKRNIPSVAVAIGDSTNGLYTINTLNSIATLHTMAIKCNKPLSLVYVNNESYFKDNINEAIKNANIDVFNSLSALSLFLSGDNHGLDTQDMINIVDQSNYTTMDIPAGLYALNSYSKSITLPVGCGIIGARTLTIAGVSPDINFKDLAHSKSGEVTAENAISIYKNSLPIHLVSYVNFFTMEEERLTKKVASTRDYMASIKVNKVSGTNDADDDGFVF